MTIDQRRLCRLVLIVVTAVTVGMAVSLARPNAASAACTRFAPVVDSACGTYGWLYIQGYSTPSTAIRDNIFYVLGATYTNYPCLTLQYDPLAAGQPVSVCGSYAAVGGAAGYRKSKCIFNSGFPPYWGHCTTDWH